MIKEKRRRLLEPAAWALLATAFLRVLTGVIAVLSGSSAEPFGVLVTTEAGAFVGPEVLLLPVLAVVLATHVGPPLDRAVPIAAGALATQAVAVMFGLLALLSSPGLQDASGFAKLRTFLETGASLAVLVVAALFSLAVLRSRDVRPTIDPFAERSLAQPRQAREQPPPEGYPRPHGQPLPGPSSEPGPRGAPVPPEGGGPQVLDDYQSRPQGAGQWQQQQPPAPGHAGTKPAWQQDPYGQVPHPHGEGHPYGQPYSPSGQGAGAGPGAPGEEPWVGPGQQPPGTRGEPQPTESLAYEAYDLPVPPDAEREGVEPPPLRPDWSRPPQPPR